MATFLEAMDSPGGYAAIGSVGNAINAGQSTRAYERMLGQQTAQLKNQIAYQRKIMEEQIALRAQERIRQQMMAQAAGDAFASSMGQYQNFEDRIGSRSNDIAGTFQNVLARQTPDISPQAQGAVADRIASANQLANERSAADAQSLANVQGLARAFSDSGMAANRNNQVASLLRNFSSGSAGASDAEVESRAGRLFQPRLIEPAPSMLGDMFVGLSSLGIQAANRPSPPPSPYAFDLSGLPQTGLRYDTGGVGIRTDRPSGLGLRTSGVRTVGG
jgi:hypothetical protein